MAAEVRNVDLANRVAHDAQPTGIEEAVEADLFIGAVPIMDSVYVAIRELCRLGGHQGS